MRHYVKLLSAAAAVALALFSSQSYAETAKVSSFGYGFNPSDSTSTLKTAFNSGVSTIVVDKQSGPWITSETLHLPSNLEIVFEEGAEIRAKKNCFTALKAPLLRMEDVENVIIRGEAEGKRGILRMLKADYTTTAYEKSEWRHTIYVRSSTNILVQDMNAYESGGDGICFGVSETGNPSKDIVVRRCTFDKHHRQGLSIGAIVNGLFEDVEFTNTSGTAPEAGIDFEPDLNTEPLTNLVFRRCKSTGNAGCGYQFHLPNQDEESGPLGIIFDSCTASGNQGNELSIYCINGDGFDRPGYLIFRNCEFASNSSTIALNCTNADGFATIFENTTFKNIHQGSSAPLQIGYGKGSTGTAGNLHFINTTVVNDTGSADAPFKFNDGGIVGGLQNVSGSIQYSKNGGTTYTDHPLTAVPRTDSEILPLLDIADMSFEAVTPSATVTGNFDNTITLPGKGQWKILGKKNSTLTLKVKHVKRTEPAEDTEVDNARVTLRGPSSSSATLLGEIVLGETADFSQKLYEDGIYTLTVTAATIGTVSQHSQILACNQPIQILLNGMDGVSFQLASGTTYFYVPAGTEKFALQFLCDSRSKTNATVYDSDNTIIFQETEINRAKQAFWSWDTATKGTYPGGVFKLELAVPSSAPADGFSMKLCNIPPLLTLAPEYVIKQK